MAQRFGFEFSAECTATLDKVCAGHETDALRLFHRSNAALSDNEFNNLMNVLIGIRALKLASEVARAQYQRNTQSVLALYWYGLAEVHAGRPDDAIALMSDGIRRLGQQPALYLIVGLAMMSVGSLQHAGTTFQSAMGMPGAPAVGLAYIGEVLRLMGQFDQAVACHQKCLGDGCKDAEAFYLAAIANYDAGQIDQASLCYEKALAAKPYYLDAHDAYNKILWEHGRRAEFMRSFETASKQLPDLLPLELRHVHFRILSGQIKAANDQLDGCLSRFGASARLCAELANVKGQLDKDYDPLPLYEQAYEADPTEPSVLKSYSRALIARERYADAVGVLRKLQNLDGFDQECLAFLAACNSHVSPEEAARVNDYENLVQIFDMPVPDGFASMAAFNEALLKALQPLHRTEGAPIDQTLVNGTQTHGMLFNTNKVELKKLEASLKSCVQEYINHLKAHGPEEMKSRASDNFEFSGAWSVQLAGEGHHVDHVHSAGWISSVYYAEVPEGLDADSHEGWLKFGDIPFDPQNTGPKRFVEPKPGRLVLFPSYMLHGTVPIKEGKRRTTVAFDVVPV